MPTFIVNKNSQSNGDYEVHDQASGYGCLPDSSNQAWLGSYSSCSAAVDAANSLGYRPANGCFYCATSCHTS